MEVDLFVAVAFLPILGESNLMDRQEQNFFTKEENEAIHKILLRILEKWQTDWKLGEEELEKTVILSSGRATRPEPSSSLESIEEKEESLAATVVLSPKEGRLRPSSPPLTEKLKEQERFVKTEEPPEKDEFLEETVILKPKKVREKLNE